MKMGNGSDLECSARCISRGRFICNAQKEVGYVCEKDIYSGQWGETAGIALAIV